MATTGILVVETELSEQEDSEPNWSTDGYQAVVVVGRFHGEVIGQERVVLTDGCRTRTEVEEYARGQLSAQIEEHLRADEEVAMTSVPAEPSCVLARRAALAEAPPLTVVIPTRDRPDRLRRCLSSLLQGSYPGDRLTVLVVDNASRDTSTKAVVDEYTEVARVAYLFEGSSGSASARNRALPEIETEFVVFTDDDTRMDEHWLIEIVRGFWSDKSADVVSGLLLPSQLETPAQLWFEEYGGFSRGFTRRVFDVGDHWPLDEPLFPFSAGLFGTGNNMAFRTKTLRDIGGFDPALGNGTPALGGVDSEVLLRSILLGHRLVYQPSAIVYHEHRRDLDSLKRQIFAYGTGLSAYLTKTLWTNPKLIPLFLSLLPRGIAFEADPSSKKNSRKTPGYPRSLTITEWRGIAYGPIAYLLSRRAYGHHESPKAVSKATRRPSRGLSGPVPALSRAVARRPGHVD